MTPGSALAIRFNSGVGYDENSQPWGGIVAKSRGGARDNRDYMLAASLSSVRGSRWANELRGQLAYRDQTVRSLDCGGVCIGDAGGPRVDLAGIASAGRFNTLPQPRRAIRYQLLDTVGYDTGRHRLKAGADFNLVDNRISAVSFSFGGQYAFADIPAALAPAFGLPGPITALQALQLGLPAAYIKGYGDPDSPHTVQDLSAFAQDEWTIGRRLTLRPGVRYQAQFWPDYSYTSPGIDGSYRLPANHNVAPRLGLAWDLRGDGRSAITAAYGLFFDNQFLVPVVLPQVVNGRQVRGVVLQGPGAVTAWRSPGHQLPDAALAQFPSLTINVDPALDTPYAHHASVAVKHDFDRRFSVTVSGVVAKGNHYAGGIDYNPVLPALGPNRRPLDVNGVAGTSSAASQFTSWGESWYRGLLATVSGRFPRGAQWTAAYTLSKAEDSISDFVNQPPQDPGRGRNPDDPTGLPLGFDPQSERGPSLQDQRHRLAVSGFWELPWQLQISAIAIAGSGRPFNIIAGADLNGDGDNGVSPGPDRPRAVPADPGTSISRNLGLLPGEKRFDVRISKSFRIASRARVGASLDILNAFNTTNFTDVNRVFGRGAYPSAPLPSFGQYTQAAPPRQIQLGLRFSF